MRSTRAKNPDLPREPPICGDVDMYEVVKAIVEEEHRRRSR